jgi:hypothetical protein
MRDNQSLIPARSCCFISAPNVRVVGDLSTNESNKGLCEYGPLVRVQIGLLEIVHSLNQVLIEAEKLEAGAL